MPIFRNVLLATKRRYLLCGRGGGGGGGEVWGQLK